jgi:hypothetical protein
MNKKNEDKYAQRILKKINNLHLSLFYDKKKKEKEKKKMNTGIIMHIIKNNFLLIFLVYYYGHNFQENLLVIDLSLFYSFLFTN